MPVFSDLPAAELTLLGDQLASGFAAGHADMHFQPGSDVAVFGAGPVGLGAIQAGRVMGAGQVIAIDPIKYRREFALKMGATIALDPVAEGDGLVERVRELCRGDRTIGDSPAASAGDAPATPSWRAAPTSSSRPRGSRRFRRRSKRSRIRPT